MVHERRSPVGWFRAVSPESRPTLYLHSGTFKTGSSSIQLSLARSSDALADVGARYPSIGRHNGVQHVNLVAELKGWKAYTPAAGGWQDLFEHIRETRTAHTIVSSESFSSLSPEEVARIGHMCAAYDVRLVWVHYVREQSSLVNAFYVERLMTMRPEFADLILRPFSEFLDWSPVSLDFLYYSRFVEMVASAIPGVDLRVRPFSRPLLQGGDVIRDFCATIGLDVDLSANADTNVGAGWRTTELARYLTPLFGRVDLSGRVRGALNPTTARLRSIALVRRELMEASTAAGWNAESAIYATADDRGRLRDLFREDNRRLSTLCDFDFLDLVESSEDKPPNAGHLEDIPTRDLLKVMDRVLPAVVDPPLPEELSS